MDLRQVLFVSHARVSEYSPEVLDILRAGLRNNTRLGITGCLHVQDSSFFQCVEGRHNDLTMLMSRIDHDPRNAKLSVLSDQKVTRRLFDGWHMGLASNHGLSLHDVMPDKRAPLHDVEPQALLDFLLCVAHLKSTEIPDTSEPAPPKQILRVGSNG
ncbi:MAG: BLUF domain-containing protein [Pseudomonadota bacterium]